MVLTRIAALYALAATAAGEQIESVNQLNAAIARGPVRAVGFLSRGNYEAIASVLPRTTDNDGPLEVRTYDDQVDLEADMRAVEGTRRALVGELAQLEAARTQGSSLIICLTSQSLHMVT